MEAECVHFLGGGEDNDQIIVNGKNVKKMPVSDRVGYVAGSTAGSYSSWTADKDEVEVNYQQMADGQQVTWLSGPKGKFIQLLLLVLVFLLGMVSGYLIHIRQHSSVLAPVGPTTGTVQSTNNTWLAGHLKAGVTVDSLRAFLQNFTDLVPISGTKNSRLLLQMLGDLILRSGLKKHDYSYTVLLSYPRWEQPNSVSLINSTGGLMFSSHLPDEEVLHPEGQTYNAFSANGTVEADLVYVNYGEENDFNELKKLNVSIQGKLVLMRYGHIYRGHKVELAQAAGAAGVILFTDQSDVTDLYSSPADLYPYTWWLPGDVGQSGSVLADILGDPSTPGLPSIPGVVRARQPKFPTVPVYSIGYSDAHELIRFLSGSICPSDFKVVTNCSIGPGYESPRKGWKVRLDVHSQIDPKLITNVMGSIRGSIEPDRYVIVGSHYDVWSNGTVDPGSGVAILSELVKAFGELKDTGWQPRRTILFMYWDAEEPGLMGSYEWIEDYWAQLYGSAVVYINLDGVVRGNCSLDVQATPLLQQLILDISKSHPAPGTNVSMYEQWARVSNTKVPSVSMMNGGSDHAPFLYLLGVPSLWPKHMFNTSTHNIKIYPAYHTRLDNMDYMNRFIDPGLIVHQAMTKLLIDIVLQLSSQPKLPFHVEELSKELENGWDEVLSYLDQHHIPSNLTEDLQWAVGNFSMKASDFQDSLDLLNASNDAEVKRCNDKLLQLTRSFIHPSNTVNKSAYRNILYSPSTQGASGLFSDIRSALLEWSLATTEAKNELWTKLQTELSIALISVHNAIRALQDDLFV